MKSPNTEMLARGNQIQSKPQSVVRCARGNGELIPATTVYKPLLLSCFIGLQFIYSWITLFFVFCFFLLVGFHVHEILDFRVETARSRKSVLRFYILQAVSFVSIFFFFFRIQAHSDYTLVQNPLAGSTGSANYVQVTYCQAGPDHLPFFLP